MLKRGLKAIYRRMADSDLKGILRIQSENLLSSLNAAEREQGFLSGTFTAEQLQVINDDVAVIVAVSDREVLGYLCSSTCALNMQFPLLAHMISRFSQISYKDRLLSEHRTFIAGPVCIDKPYRGRGVFENLYRRLIEEVDGKYDVGVAFVSEENPRSLSAHVEKVGMEEADRFEFKGKRYISLVLDVNATHLRNLEDAYESL